MAAHSMYCPRAYTDAHNARCTCGLADLIETNEERDKLKHQVRQLKTLMSHIVDVCSVPFDVNSISLLLERLCQIREIAITTTEEGEPCNSAHNWDSVYRCRGCGYVLPEAYFDDVKCYLCTELTEDDREIIDSNAQDVPTEEPK